VSDFSAHLQAALAPQYTLERELTGGGMSRVFVATDVALGRKVVVKVLPPELAAGVNHERFRREIQVCAQLQHPHIVPLLSAGEKESLIWYTMPFIAGHSMREALARGDKFPVKDVLRIMGEVAEALDYAHGLGVIHRDIKPGNVLLLGSHALVTDFGVAKAISAAMPSSGFTSAGMAIGTPAYMAPEQIAADPAADHRMDLYALGLLGYEMLTGQVPFKEDSPQKTMAAQLTREPDPVETSRADVPPKLAILIKRLLAKIPSDRPGLASEVVTELEDIAMSSGASLAPLRPLRRPSILKAAAVIAGGIAIVGAAWMLGERAGNVEATNFVRDSLAAADSSALVANAAAMLTREDSMAIARAVSEKMKVAPSRVASSRTSGGSVSGSAQSDSVRLLRMADSLRQEIQRTVLDSIVRLGPGMGQAMVITTEAARLASDARTMSNSLLDGTKIAVDLGGVGRPRPGAAQQYAEALKAGPRRVVVALPRPSRTRPELDQIAVVIADSLRHHLSRNTRFVLVPADSVAAALQTSRTVNGIQESLNADVIVSISLLPKNDSVVRMINLRDLKSRSGFNYRVISHTAPATDVTAGLSAAAPQAVLELLEMERGNYFSRDPRDLDRTFRAVPRPATEARPPQPAVTPPATTPPADGTDQG
jgi:serine/threonine protein kinase